MYKVIIGLEVHCQLKTNSKNFSSAKNTFSEKPNTDVSPADLGHPGTLPYPNKDAVYKALKTSLALNCNVPDEVIFDRKNYFYPDLPKGYQITQITKPMGKSGYLMVRVGDDIKRVDIHQLHLEEDTASLEHFPNFSLLDYNRSGIPLIEIVTEPCIYSADEAVAFLETLRNVFLYCGVSNADSKKGQMRCDVNISVMKDTDTEFGTKVEMKNINAFTTVRNSIEYEIKRQIEVLESGGKVVQETRRYSDEDGKTHTMREKVDAIDYKYYLDPNIPPVLLSEEYISDIKKDIPMLEFDRINKYINDYELSLYDSTILAKDRSVADYFEKVLDFGVDPKLSANWIITVILGSLNKLKVGIDDFFINPKMLSDVIKLVSNGELSQNHAKTILYKAMDTLKNPLEIIQEQGLKQIDDSNKLRPYVIDSINENNDVLMEYLEGKDYVANFFIGKVMAKTNRQANPKVTLEIIKEELEKRRGENEKK
ncbi:MAG: Asp-tRNA(Asn)/Glu-tRNA(Gln) amidotransferase subunit GatB [Bacilli bacterium]|nr:Asp-tRNA(Asn)/Glu-tRNA(Gln) amidotransferase subunit GatB [Bacilli bacterium]MDD4283019.1 Asp-tRNA(Asn)/Glu-tRNA(Gln) amidotransferase subunit GatB [Bacilli bacterium]MDD4718832.1 Asp-tRNA(Asn)/Glu-tRNA(Gln) amidotransferase subunit GatB [Bacilli bacterium]